MVEPWNTPWHVWMRRHDPRLDRVDDLGLVGVVVSVAIITVALLIARLAGTATEPSP